MRNNKKPGQIIFYYAFTMLLLCTYYASCYCRLNLSRSCREHGQGYIFYHGGSIFSPPLFEDFYFFPNNIPEKAKNNFPGRGKDWELQFSLNWYSLMGKILSSLFSWFLRVGKYVIPDLVEAKINCPRKFFS